MSVENLKIIDFVSIDLNGDAVLTISDHLEWNSDNEHLLTLQNKINAYLNAIESGNFYDEYPNAKGRNILINIASKYSPNQDGEFFLKRTKDVLKEAGYNFNFEVINNYS